MLAGVCRTSCEAPLYHFSSSEHKFSSDRLSSLRTWELLNLVGAAMPPGKDFAGYISEFVHEHAHDQNLDPEIRTAALATWQSLKRSVKAGPRKMVPTAEEVDSLKVSRALEDTCVSATVYTDHHLPFL